MRSHLFRAGVLGALFGVAGCGGGGYGGTTPSPPAGGTPASVTVNIVGDRGNQSFNPNPASPGAALTVAWQNADGVTHRIVANDNSFDTGNIGGNGKSITVTVPAAGINYHCSIHPHMTGAINGASGTAPPCTGQYCGNQ
jgi:plastocyanin